ncbi:hypothetical protein OAP26_03385 [Flavobacteriaceae bacterium]|nr:hypothetical protein [Flavobacteriaceae bacterium]
MATASFKIRKGKNKSIIYLQVQKGRDFRLRQSTSIYIKNESLKFWDIKKERIKNLSNIPEAEYINGKLTEVSKSVNDKILQLYKQRKLDKLSCKKVINEVLGSKGKNKKDEKNNEGQSKVVLEYFNWYLEYYKTNNSSYSNKPLTLGTLKTYKNSRNYLVRFLKKE